MSRCEDYPCCGHGPPPLGDDGGCPDEQGRFDCVLCHKKMPKGAHSAICDKCRSRPANLHEVGSPEWEDEIQREEDQCRGE